MTGSNLLSKQEVNKKIQQWNSVGEYSITKFFIIIIIDISSK